MTKARTKATREIEGYLVSIEKNIHHLIGMGVKCWQIQVTNDILNRVEEYYKPKEKEASNS